LARATTSNEGGAVYNKSSLTVTIFGGASGRVILDSKGMERGLMGSGCIGTGSGDCY